MDLPQFDPALHGWGSDDPESILVGPPGTGKTRAVLTAFLEPSVTDGGGGILGCSFTKAAALEMEERLVMATSCDQRTAKLTCKTIHSEAYRLVRRAYGSSVTGVLADQDAAKRMRSLSEEDKAKIAAVERAALRPPRARQAMLGEEAEDDDGLADLAEMLHSSPLDGLAIPGSDLTSEAIRLWGKARHVYPDIVTEGDDALRRGLSAVYTDEGDVRHPLASIVAEVLAFEALKASIGAIDFTDMLSLALGVDSPHRRLLVVDEAQDLSPLQIRLVEHWASAADHLVWVGDPDQAIYGFAGADGKHIHDRIRSGVPARRLTQSWRVPKAVHQLARPLILLSRDRVDAPYDPSDKPGSVVVGRGGNMAEDAVGWALNGAGSVMIIARAVRFLTDYLAVLARKGVPFRNERGASPWGQRAQCEVVMALDALLRGRLLTGEMVFRLASAAPGRPKGRWFKGTKKAAKEWAKAKADAGAVGLSAGMVEDLGGVRTAGMAELGDLRGIVGAWGKAKEYEMQIVLLERGGPAALRDEPRTLLTTIHGAKGREAETVLLDLSAPYPCQREILRDGPDAERRVVYVAVTRALHRLGILVPDDSSRSLAHLTGLEV